MTARRTSGTDLLRSAFRSNPAYEFVPFRSFVGAEREMIADLERDPDVCGMLRPRTHTTLGVKAATRAVASLFRARRSPGPLPDRLRRLASESSHSEQITRLVLDGVLEVENDGQFVSGVGADYLLSASHSELGATDSLDALSSDAIRYGEALEVDSPSALSWRIYSYNRIPITPRWAHRLPTRDAVLEFLGLAPGSELRRQLDRGWSLRPGDDTHDWLMWTPRQAPPRRGDDEPMHKIYVSPTPSQLREAMPIVVRALAECEPTMFKIGGDIHGLFRPDKLVVYFTDRIQLEEIALNLAHSLGGMAPHGVPFTAPLHGGGLLSRGLDPPRSTSVFRSRGSESWRLWVTNRLAVYLLTARATRTANTAMSDAQFATARLRLDGVDTQQWTPDAIEWAQSASGN